MSRYASIFPRAQSLFNITILGPISCPYTSLVAMETICLLLPPRTGCPGLLGVRLVVEVGEQGNVGEVVEDESPVEQVGEPTVHIDGIGGVSQDGPELNL